MCIRDSYFLRFGNDCRLELMRRRDIAARGSAERPGLCHLAFGCRSREAMFALTERLRAEGRPVVGEPRTGGDGYFESVGEDPGGNRVEIVRE